ncbi:MAG: hypothetical protein FJ146_18480 [Deltaproteobacteria bacterium]|nr:hypothetical protein [Deltaproteobacteria bacterium]
MSVATARKWGATIRISWNKLLSYKLNLLLLVIGPSVVFFFVKYSLWTAIFQLEGIEQLQGYDLGGMLQYQGWTLIVALLGQGYNSMNLAEDIRLGRISAFLVYPFGFWSFQTASFIAFECLQLFTAAITLSGLLLLGIVTHLTLTSLLAGLCFSVLVSFFWYQTSYLIGLMAFWLEETWVLRVMFLTITQFFSGAVMPLEVYPEYLQRLLMWTPFPYLTYAPVKIFMGEYQGDIMMGAGILSFWLGITALASLAVWRRGLRLYTAAGM